MKTKHYLSIVIILTMLLVLVSASGVSAAAEKTDVCHLDKEMGIYKLINISDNAFESHVAHGDGEPGKAVPLMTGMFFAADCTPTADVGGTWTGFSGAVGNLVYAFTMTLTQVDKTVTGTIVYAGFWNGTRNVTGTVSGNVLSIHTFDNLSIPTAPYWADVSGNVVNGNSFYGTGTDSNSVNVAITATK